MRGHTSSAEGDESDQIRAVPLIDVNCGGRGDRGGGRSGKQRLGVRYRLQCRGKTANPIGLASSSTGVGRIRKRFRW